MSAPVPQNNFGSIGSGFATLNLTNVDLDLVKNGRDPENCSYRYILLNLNLSFFVIWLIENSVVHKFLVFGMRGHT